MPSIREFLHGLAGLIITLARWATSTVLGLVRGIRTTFHWLARCLCVLIALFGFILLIGFVFWRTERDVAYRYSEPGSSACNQQAAKADALALGDDDTKTNDEIEAIRRDGDLRDALTCMVQVHELPRQQVSLSPLRFHLAFLEFSEEGEPAETNTHGDTLKANQLAALIEHLRKQRREGNHNFVIAFIHGWRHDASIGDSDVQKLRLFAAYAASFLDQRCAALKRDCRTVVTAVYFGWRGARVAEQWLARNDATGVGRILDTMFGSVPALLTLFDRKPVSERIGPAAITALRRIDVETYNRHMPQGWKQDTESRMITFGHSLGGNMLASALRETMIDRIRRHVSGSLMTAPFGDLIILLNPASEAENWTVLQRAMREKIRFLYSVRESSGETALLENEGKDIEAGHKFFSNRQPPIYVSLGSANSWPAGGIRNADASYLWKLVNEGSEGATKVEAAERTCDELFRRREILDRPHYDRATHDLFPTFKWDFRPLAQTLAARAQGDRISEICALNNLTPPADSAVDETDNKYWLAAAAFLRNFPFMNTNVEQTSTIGHLIPVRSPIGSLENGSILPSTVYGTTHELIVNLGGGADAGFLKGSYRSAARPAHAECAVVDGWLYEARRRAGGNGILWDTGYTSGGFVQKGLANITPVRARPRLEDGRIESQFRHGLLNSGMAPIVRANDPFWNVRVFETGMQDHGGYDSYPLICAILQLVMDKIVEEGTPNRSTSSPQ